MTVEKILEGLLEDKGCVSLHRKVDQPEKAIFYDRNPAAGSPRMGLEIPMPFFKIMRERGLITREAQSASAPEIRSYKISAAGTSYISAKRENNSN